jgi:hypothetical protein
MKILEWVKIVITVSTIKVSRQMFRTLIVCREGYFLLPYNELAIAQGPKIQQKNKL